MTSRVPLQLTWEHRYPVQGLALPETEPSARLLAESAAATLFAERAQALLPNFCLTEDNAGAVVEICHRLDGVPLALEDRRRSNRRAFAAGDPAKASRPPGLDLPAAGTRDAPERHQTLRSAIAWSERLLAAARTCGLPTADCFAGGFTADAAQAVCSDSDTQTNLASLVRENPYTSIPEKPGPAAPHAGDGPRVRPGAARTAERSKCRIAPAPPQTGV